MRKLAKDDSINKKKREKQQDGDGKDGNKEYNIDNDDTQKENVLDS